MLEIWILMTQFVLLLAIAFAYHKTTKVLAYSQANRKREGEQFYNQLEALIGLYVELKFEHALPTTRVWAASPDFLNAVMLHILKDKPETVIEFGSGVSTVIIAQSLKRLGRGHIYTLEHDPIYAGKSKEAIKRHGLEEYSTIVDAPIIPAKLDNHSAPWYDMTQLPEEIVFDLMIVDGPPEAFGSLARYPAIPKLHHRLKPNATIFIDDYVRIDEQQMVDHWLSEYSDLSVAPSPFCEKGCKVLIKNQ